MRSPDCLLVILLLAPLAAAAEAPSAKGVPPHPAATPQQTTATFTDWTLRCTRTPPSVSCEVVQGVGAQDRAIAQIALGRPAHGERLRLTILVPNSVSLGANPAFAAPQDGEPSVVDLAWRRCLPAGCLADGQPTDDALRRMQGWAESGHITYNDGAGRAVALPFSSHGLQQALEALAHEEAG